MERAGPLFVTLLLVATSLNMMGVPATVGSFSVSASGSVPEGFDLGIEYLTETQFIDVLGLCRESQANPYTV